MAFDDIVNAIRSISMEISFFIMYMFYIVRQMFSFYTCKGTYTLWAGKRIFPKRGWENPYCCFSVFWLLLVFLYVSTYATLYAATQLVQFDGVGQFHNSIDNHGPAYNE